MSVANREIGTGLDPRQGSFPRTRSPTAENNHCDEGRSEQAADLQFYANGLVLPNASVRCDLDHNLR